MATTFCGAVALSAVFPGFVAVLAPLRAALVSLRADVQVALLAVASARAQIEASIETVLGLEAELSAALGTHTDGLASAKLAIRAKALADLEAQLSAALDVSVSLEASLGDPAAAISGLVSAVGAVQVDLAALVPQVALQAQLDASLDLVVELQARIAAFDLVLELLAQLSAALQLAVDAVLEVSAELRAVLALAVQAMVALSAALQAGFDATTAPLNAALALEADLATGPAEVFRYDGALSGLGASVDASVAAHSAIAGAAGVRIWVVVAPDANAALQGHLSALLKTNP